MTDHFSNGEILLAVGSLNPVKINSALLGFQAMFPHRNFATTGFDAPSGVASQPMSSAETRLGAFNRAAATQASVPKASFFIGIEGGIETVDETLFAFAWIVVLGGATTAAARSASFPLPPEVKRLVKSGLELGLANDRVFAEHNSKQAGGAVGSLTAGAVSRQDLYEHAMRLALVPLINEAMFTG